MARWHDTMMIRRWTLAAVALAVLGAPLTLPAQEAGAAPAAAEQEASPAAVEGLAERFRLVPLTETLLLEPRTPQADLHMIEVGDGFVGIDGRRLGDGDYDQLEELVGADLAAELAALAALDQVERVEIATAAEVEAAGQVEPGPKVHVEITKPLRPPKPPKPPRRHRHGGDSEVAFGSTLIVDPDEIVDDVVSFGGPLNIYGEVNGDALSFGGPIVVEGTVRGEIASFGGPITLKSGSVVHGDIATFGGPVHREEGAEVWGEIIDTPTNFSFSGGLWPLLRFRAWDDRGHDVDIGWEAMSLGWRILIPAVCLVLLALIALLTMLIARRPVERVGRQAAGQPWKSLLVGFCAQVLFVPLVVMVGLILLISVIGIPLLFLLALVVFIVLPVLALLGYVAVAHRLGLWARRRFGWEISDGYLVLLLGIGLIEVWSFIGTILGGDMPLVIFGAMFLIVGCLLEYAVWTTGFGAMLLTRAGTREPALPGASAAASDEPTAPPAPPEPEPPSDLGIPPASSTDWE